MDAPTDKKSYPSKNHKPRRYLPLHALFLPRHSEGRHKPGKHPRHKCDGINSASLRKRTYRSFHSRSETQPTKVGISIPAQLCSAELSIIPPPHPHRILCFIPPLFSLFPRTHYVSHLHLKRNADEKLHGRVGRGLYRRAVKRVKLTYLKGFARLSRRDKLRLISY